MDRVHTRIRDIPSCVILTLALLTVSQRLTITGWASGLEAVHLLTLVGAILGLALGVSDFKRKAVFWIAFGYGLPVLIMVMAGYIYNNLPDLEIITNLSDRLLNSFALFLSGQPVIDTAFFVALVSVGFWIVSLISSFILARSGNFSGSVVPAGVALVIIQLYDPGNIGHDILLGYYFFYSLLLLGQLIYVRNRILWKEQRVSVLTEARTELQFFLLITTFLLVTLAWTIPSLGHTFLGASNLWKNITRPFQNIQENLGHVVAGIEGGEGTGSIMSFSDSLPLGQQAETRTSIYLSILTPIDRKTTRYYWHVRAYNIYQDGKWFTEGISAEPFRSNQKPISLPDPGDSTERFTFTSQQVGLSILVTPARPVWVSSPSYLTFFQASTGSIDPILFRAEAPILDGRKYEVEASASEPTVIQLRNASEDYPAWVIAHYLQLPEDFPMEITNLAHQITASYGTPYDKAAAITTYLRSHITYKKFIQDPPAGMDPLTWFLFDSRTGFCNYFASAEVVLLRSIGIPSRLAVGFAQGEYKSPNQYTVHQSDAHAWPEVYFPGFGWVEFEPTVSQPLLARPFGVIVPAEGVTGTQQPNGTKESNNQQEDIPTPEIGDEIGSGSGASANFVFGIIFIIILFGILVTAILLISPFGLFDKIFVRMRHTFQQPFPVLIQKLLENLSLSSPAWLEYWANFTQLNPIEKSFSVVYRSLRWLGAKISPAQTPARAAASLIELLPDASEEIKSLLHEYQHSLYGRDAGNLQKARSANKMIWRKTLHIFTLNFRTIIEDRMG
jgi:transglutaminase-like putative cysteine protease